MASDILHLPQVELVASYAKTLTMTLQLTEKVPSSPRQVRDRGRRRLSEQNTTFVWIWASPILA